MRVDVGIFFYQLDKVVIKRSRIQRAKLQGRQMGKRFENFANQTAERGLIRAGVNTGETDFFKPLFKQFPNLPEDFVFRYRAVVAAGIGDDTVEIGRAHV